MLQSADVLQHRPAQAFRSLPLWMPEFTDMENMTIWMFLIYKCPRLDDSVVFPLI